MELYTAYNYCLLLWYPIGVYISYVQEPYTTDMYHNSMSILQSK